MSINSHHCWKRRLSLQKTKSSAWSTRFSRLITLCTGNAVPTPTISLISIPSYITCESYNLSLISNLTTQLATVFFKMASSSITLNKVAPLSSDSGSPRSSIETKNEQFHESDDDSDETPFTSPELPNIQEPKDLIDMVSQALLAGEEFKLSSHLVHKCRDGGYFLHGSTGRVSYFIG